MKTCRILLFCLLVSNFYAFAQKDPIKFGEVDEKDIKATKYDKFPDAEAIILCGYGQNKVELSINNTNSNSEYIFRIKILSKAGYERANITIPFYGQGTQRERVSDIKGYTYNMEAGKVVKTKLEKSNITEKMVNKYYGEVKFALPNVKEGSVIEYAYEVRSDFDGGIPAWYFQNSIPTLWSEYRVSIPEMYDFAKISQGYQPFTTNETKSSTGSLSNPKGTPMSYQINNSRWVAENIPAFKNESFIASATDHVMKIEFNLVAIKDFSGNRKPLIDDWQKVCKILLQNEKYGKYLTKTLPDKTVVATLIANKNTPKEKALAVYEYVKTTFKYNGRNGVQTRKSLKDVWEKKVGNSSEINLLLVNMLREAGITAEPVVLSTRNNGKVATEYPLIDKFNYTVVYINAGNEEMLLDATDPLLVAGMLAYPALNGVGLLVKENAPPTGEWVNLQLSKFAKTTKMVISNLAITKDGIVKGELSTKFGGYEAIEIRRKNLAELSFVVEEGAEDDEEAPPTVETEKKEDKSKNKFTFKNLKEFDKPLEAVSQIESNEYSQVNDDFIYFSPMLEFKMKENPLKSETRAFPIDYASATDHSFYMNFTIPEGYKVEELPKPFRIKWQDNSVKFDYVMEAKENKIQLMSRFVLTRPLFAPEEYKQLRELYAQIVSKQEEQIVLKKK